MASWSPSMTGSLHNQTVPNTETAGGCFLTGMSSPPLSTSYNDVTFTLKHSGSALTGTLYALHLSSVGATLATSAGVAASTLTSSYQDVKFTFSTPISLSSDEAIVFDNRSSSGSVIMKANTSTGTPNYVSCQQSPVYSPSSSSARIGNYIELTFDASPAPGSGGARLPPPPLVVHF